MLDFLFFRVVLFAVDSSSKDMIRSRTLSTATFDGAVTSTFHFLMLTAHRISSATVVVLPARTRGPDEDGDERIYNFMEIICIMCLNLTHLYQEVHVSN